MSHRAALEAALKTLDGGNSPRAAAAIDSLTKRPSHCDACDKRLDDSVVNDCTRPDCPCAGKQAA